MIRNYDIIKFISSCLLEFTSCFNLGFSHDLVGVLISAPLLHIDIFPEILSTSLWCLFLVNISCFVILWTFFFGSLCFILIPVISISCHMLHDSIFFLRYPPLPYHFCIVLLALLSCMTSVHLYPRYIILYSSHISCFVIFSITISWVFPICTSFCLFLFHI